MPTSAAPQAKPPAAARPAPKPAPAAAPKPEVRPAAPPATAAGAKVQAKSALPTSSPGDAAEREADRVATRVMRAAAPAGHDGSAPSATAGDGPQLGADHIARLGPGEPLPPDLRAQFEPRFGTSLEDVRVLTDGAAAEAATSIQARAFTLGHRIGFAAGEYQPTTNEGQWLLAHEIAHVLQQRDDSVPRVVMRDATPGAGGGAPAGAGGGGGGAPPGGGVTRAAATPGAPRFRLQTALRIPPIKGRHSPTYATLASHGGLIRPRAYDSSTRGTAQAALWTGGIVPDLSQIPADRRPAPGSPWTLVLEQNGIAVRTITAADDAALRDQLCRPAWDASGVATTFQVDHMVEYQLGGNDHVDNMELLDQQHNGSVGSSFNAEIRRAIRLELETNRRPAQAPGAPAPAALSVADVMQFYDIEFAESTGRARESHHTEGGAAFWSAADIRRLEPIRPLLPPRTGNLAGTAQSIHVLSPSGNLVLLRLPVVNGQPQVPAGGASNIAGFTLTGVNVAGGAGALAGSAAASGAGHQLQGLLNLGAAVTFPAGAQHYLALDKAAMPYTLQVASTASGAAGDRDATRAPAEFRPLSPLTLSGLQVGRAVIGQAEIQPSHPLLSGLRLPGQVRDGRVGMFYTVDATALAQRLQIPGLTMDAAAITLGYDGSDFSVDGGAEFTIRNFGTGYLNANVDTRGRFGMEGGLHADTRLFDQADLRLWYRSEGGFGGEGTLAITNPNKIRGIRAARVTARYDAGVFSAAGSVEPTIPGLQSAGLAVRYGPDAEGAQSLLIAGDLQLAPGVPGVRGGQAHVELLQRDGEWQVAANGELQPAIPGINATLRARYERGAFTASVDTPFHVGERLSGQLLVGVSNVESDSQGRPVEGAVPGDRLLAFGQGSATIRLSDQFQGDFGIRVGTDAAVRINGSVGISQPITLFEARTWSRELVHFPTISIPIFGVAVGGNVVGIAATIGGGINAEASIGPGLIDQGSIGVRDFDPAQPDSLHVTGRVHFNVPAQAGINGHLDAGISAGLAVIRATGGLSIALNLGVNAGAGAGLDLDWTQAQGLSLAATLHASATPRLRASVNGFAEVVADAFVTSFTLWRKDYTLAQREFGSGLTVGVNVPVTWTEQRGLDFDLNRVQFQVPEITPDGALAGLLRDEGSTTERNERPAS